MDYKIVWTDRSLAKLEQLVEYIAENDPFAAEKMGLRIYEKTLLLSQFPYLGARFLKLERNDIREIAIPPFRVIYQILDEPKTVSILTVWHGAQPEPEALI